LYGREEPGSRLEPEQRRALGSRNPAGGADHVSAGAPVVLPERPPKPGELVHVRSRRWIVEEVSEPQAGVSSVVGLACVDDDNQGQALQVLWDYEPDRWILADEG